MTDTLRRCTRPRSRIASTAAVLLVLGSSAAASGRAQFDASVSLVLDPVVADASFGNSVAMDGNILAVGATNGGLAANKRLGAAFVFERDGSDWTQVAQLKPVELAGFDLFGVSVDVDGDVVVVGAQLDRTTRSQAGAAWVYRRNDGVWAFEARLETASLQQNDHCGADVAVSGDVIVMGCRLSDVAEARKGAAFVFERLDGVWTETADLRADSYVDLELFGRSVAVHKKTIVVGSEGEDNEGAAFIFTGKKGKAKGARAGARAALAWTLSARLDAVEPGTQSDFGWDVAIDKKRIVVGAPSVFDRPRGAAYVFEKKKGDWTQIARLNGDADANQLTYAAHVAIGGRFAAVTRTAAFSGTGSVFVYERANGTWSQSHKLVGTDADQWTFGDSVAVSKNRLAVGASGANDNEGHVTVFQ